MENRENLIVALHELKEDNIQKSKRGLHFIIASVLIWGAVLCIHLSPLSILTKNLLTFCCSTLLVPMAYLISKSIGVDFQNKGNPFSNLGLLFALNQILYILIAMWVYTAMPEKFLMVYSMIFGAHFLPFGWLYESKTYYVVSILLPIVVLLLGCNYPPVIIAALIFFVEIILSICLMIENKRSKSSK